MNAATVTAHLPELLAGLGAPLPDLRVTGVDLDSRRIVPGALFLAAQGSGKHGLGFVEQALERGANAVAWEPVQGLEPPVLPVPSIAVPRLSAQAGEIAARFWKYPSRAMFCAGVTGTDGKTSTAHLIAQAFDRLARPCAYFGTIGYGRLSALAPATHTTPDPVRMQELLAVQRDVGGTSAVAMEVSSHALHQHRVAGVEFDVAVLTNIGRDHLDYHRDVPSYAAAKRRLFETPGLGAAVLNGDDAYGNEWAKPNALSAPVTIFGLSAEPRPGLRHVLGKGLNLDAQGQTLNIHSSWGDARLETRLLGRFNAYNLLAALSVLLHSGVPLVPAVAALSQSSTVPGRIEGFRGPGAKPLVVVDYAHTPQAIAGVLDALRAHCKGRLICVFGCGGDRDRGKRPLMGAAAVAGSDVVILTDDNPRTEDPSSIVAEILPGIPESLRGRVTVEHDRAMAIRAAVLGAGPEDVVLVAGKGHEDYQDFGDRRLDFSDREFVARLVGQGAPA